MTDKIIAEANHQIYPKSSIEEADGCAWVFYNKDIFEKYYFKLPPIGDNDVRIRNLYAGLCMSDSHTGRGFWGQQTYPVCPGHEVAGEVTAIGKGVTKVKVGDTVLYGPTRNSCGKCEACEEKETSLCRSMDGSDRMLYGKYFGGYASHLQHPESHTYLLPKNIDLKSVAPLMCAGVTLFSPMNRHLKKGMRIGVLGIGGLGHLGVQFGVKMGMSVDAFCSGTQTDKKKYINSLGTSEIHLWKEEGVLKKLAGKYDAIIYTLPVALDVQHMDSFLALLKPRGKLILVGLPPVEQKLIMSFFSLIADEISVIGSCIGGIKDTEDMLQFCATHNVTALCEQFEWDQFPQALAKLEYGSPKFRCVVNVDNFSKNFPLKK